MLFLYIQHSWVFVVVNGIGFIGAATFAYMTRRLD